MVTCSAVSKCSTDLKHKVFYLKSDHSTYAIIMYFFLVAQSLCSDFKFVGWSLLQMCRVKFACSH